MDENCRPWRTREDWGGKAIHFCDSIDFYSTLCNSKQKTISFCRYKSIDFRLFLCSSLTSFFLSHFLSNFLFFVKFFFRVRRTRLIQTVLWTVKDLPPPSFSSFHLGVTSFTCLFVLTWFDRSHDNRLINAIATQIANFIRPFRSIRFRFLTLNSLRNLMEFILKFEINL